MPISVTRNIHGPGNVRGRASPQRAAHWGAAAGTSYTRSLPATMHTERPCFIRWPGAGQDSIKSLLQPMRKGGVTGLDARSAQRPHGFRWQTTRCCNATAFTRNKAPIIDPIAHSHHRPTKGSQCVSCHMPTTAYMQRDRVTITVSSADPCCESSNSERVQRCHTDKPSTGRSRTRIMYGGKMNRSARPRRS